MSKVALIRPPMTTVASGRCTSAPEFVESAIGTGVSHQGPGAQGLRRRAGGRVPGHRPRAEALLHALAGDGRELIAVGDPDQSIYAFRGADVHAITRFASAFRTPDEQPAEAIALRTCRRSGPVLLAASRRVTRRLPATPGTAPRPGP